MDFYILVNVFTSFIFFLIFQFISFRRIAAKHVFNAMVGVFVLAAMITNSVFYFVIRSMPLSIVIVSLVISLFLYGLLTLVYILALFGITESSIRIRLLREIAASGESGMTENELLARYNRKIILSKRLDRFLASGEVVYDGKRYKMVRRISFYLFPALLFWMVWKLYGGRVTR